MEIGLNHPIDIGINLEEKVVRHLLSLSSDGQSFFLFIDAKVWQLQRDSLRQILDFVPYNHIIQIVSPEQEKNVTSIERWTQTLNELGASRSSIFIACGGGAVLDAIGFLASVFKRGVSVVYIPTTLLSMVDASIGGKTALNVEGVKNSIGTFKAPDAVFCDIALLSSLSSEELRSGWGEILKHALLQGKDDWNTIRKTSLFEISDEELFPIIQRSIEYKKKIVLQDPYEKDIRKYLNLGHTFGHALESWSQTSCNPISHGSAVAAGLVMDLYLSTAFDSLDSSVLRDFIHYYRETFPRITFSCIHYPTILQKMRYDKKNKQEGKIVSITLKDIGLPSLYTCSEKEILEAFDFYREMI